MIGSLRGTLLDRWPSGEVLVEVAGVGYRVTITAATALDLGEPGQEVFLHIHHHRREDAETLYGFTTADERIVFEALLSAHGVGPALALAILGVHPPATRTDRIVPATVWRRAMSEISRFTWLTSSRWRALSIEKPRSSGWT